MAYTYRNKKTGGVIYLNRRAKSAFWEEVEPEKETPEQDSAEDAAQEDVTSEEEPAEAEEKPPKKTGRSRGKK